jgi:hypothetical protein
MQIRRFRFIARFIANVTYLRTNQNPRIDWRRSAPPINSWVLCSSSFDHSYRCPVPQAKEYQSHLCDRANLSTTYTEQETE